jgi:hypothetical protein
MLSIQRDAASNNTAERDPSTSSNQPQWSPTSSFEPAPIVLQMEQLSTVGVYKWTCCDPKIMLTMTYIQSEDEPAYQSISAYPSIPSYPSPHRREALLVLADFQNVLISDYQTGNINRSVRVSLLLLPDYLGTSLRTQLIPHMLTLSVPSARRVSHTPTSKAMYKPTLSGTATQIPAIRTARRIPH